MVAFSVGTLACALDWRWMFWLVLPIALGSLALGARLLAALAVVASFLVRKPDDAPASKPA